MLSRDVVDFLSTIKRTNTLDYYNKVKWELSDICGYTSKECDQELYDAAMTIMLKIIFKEA
jgi:hypothetical protein